MRASPTSPARSAIHGPLSPLWSLAEEEQFYLLWPLALPLIIRSRRGLPIIAALTITAAVYRAGMTVAGVSGHRVFMGPDTHADPILFGCLLALLYTRGHLPAWRVALPIGVALAAAAGLLLPGAETHTGLIAGIPAGELAGAALVIAAVTSPHGWLLASRPLMWLGAISYSLYLWHGMVRELIPSSTVAIPVALLAAWLSYRHIEQPFRRRRQAGLEPAMSPSAASV